MGKIQKTTYFCDLCERKMEESQLNEVLVPVKINEIDERVGVYKADIQLRYMDLCNECLDMVTVLETNVGSMFSCADDRKLKIRKGSDRS